MPAIPYPLPEGKRIEDLVRDLYENESTKVLDIAGHTHNPLGGHKSVLYLLCQDRVTEQVSATVVEYHLLFHTPPFQISVGAMPEQFLPDYYECPLSLLGQLSPTDDEGAVLWRSDCWKYWHDQAEPINQEIPTTLPVALASTSVQMVIALYAGQLVQLTWSSKTRPHYGTNVPVALHWHDISHEQGIQLQATVQCKGLQEAIALLMRQKVPLHGGWIPLHSVH